METLENGRLFLTIKSVFWVICSIYLRGILAEYSPEMESEIRNETLSLSTYDPVSRPESRTHIRVGLNVLAIDELDLRDQKLTMAGWLTFEWEDRRIHWNMTEKDDIKYIFAKPKQIWKPELIVDNALQDLEVIESKELLLRVRYDGTVDWEPAMLFVTHCEVDITYYPYDKQQCAVELVSWTYTIEEVELDHLFEAVNLEDFEIHGEWKLTHTALEDKNLTEHLPDGTVRIYPQIDFWMFLTRRTEFYNLNVMMPVILTSMMVVMVFIVPIGTGEKVSYVLTVFLSLAVLLTIVTDTLPPTSISMSILGLYLGIVLIFSAVASLLTILILILYHKEGKPRQTSFGVTLSRCAAKLVCWKSPGMEYLARNKVSPMTDRSTATLETTDVTNSDFEDNIAGKKDNFDIGSCSIVSQDAIDEVTWQDMAHVMDRFCFISFTLVTVLMNFAFVVTLSTGGN